MTNRSLDATTRASRAQPLAVLRAADHDEHTVVGQHTAAVAQGSIADIVEDRVVATPVGDEVVACVVDHMVGTERADDVDVVRSADGGDLGAHRDGDLDGVVADAATCAVDQHGVPAGEAGVVAETLQCRDGGDGEGRRFAERRVRRDPGDLARPADDVLGEGAVAAAEHLVARRELCDRSSDRFDDTGDVDASALLLRATQTGDQSEEVRRPGHEVPVERVRRRRVDTDEDLVLGRHRALHVSEFEHVRGSVPILFDRPHRRAHDWFHRVDVHCT